MPEDKPSESGGSSKAEAEPKKPPVVLDITEGKRALEEKAYGQLEKGLIIRSGRSGRSPLRRRPKGKPSSPQRKGKNNK